MNEDTLVADIAADISESVVAVIGNYRGSDATIADEYNESTAHGTGVVIKSNGTILTNAHVVKDIENITVVFNDGSSYGASCVTGCCFCGGDRKSGDGKS